MKRLAAAVVSSVSLFAGQFGLAQSAAAQDPGSLNELVELLSERIATADTVAAVKWADAQRTGQEPVVDDPEREARIYDTMGRLGAERSLPGSWVRGVFQDQIEANKLVQRGLMTEWRYGLAVSATPAQDLASVRPVIDRLNIAIMDELATRQTALAAPDCTAKLAGTVVAGAHGDALHQAALVRASTALCH